MSSCATHSDVPSLECMIELLSYVTNTFKITLGKVLVSGCNLGKIMTVIQLCVGVCITDYTDMPFV